MDASYDSIYGSLPAVSISYDDIKGAVRDGMVSYNTETSDSAGLLSDKTILCMGNTFINLYAGEIKKYWEKDKKEREDKRNEYLQKRQAQGIMTIEQVSEWASLYSIEIQRTIRYIGMRILDEDESVEKAHGLLKIWGDALQTITKSQALSSAYAKIVVALQMESFQATD